MSVELPEALILATQMNKELGGKKVKTYRLQDHEKFQRLGFISKDTRRFEKFVGGKIEFVTSRGSVMRVKLDNGMNLILAPEYGGVVLYHTSEKTVPDKFHFRVDFDDDTTLTVRLTGMGVIQAVKDNELNQSYVYRRDFSSALSPVDEKEFTFEHFSDLLLDKAMMLKSVLVGKDAVVVGLGNSSLQDVLFRAKIHPKKRASELNKEKRKALYDAVKHVIQERIRHGGKDEFLDIYGRRGDYKPAMGSNMKGQTCPTCGSSIEKLSIGGGQTYFCPRCQR